MVTRIYSRMPLCLVLLGMSVAMQVPLCALPTRGKTSAPSTRQAARRSVEYERLSLMLEEYNPSLHQQFVTHAGRVMTRTGLKGSDKKALQSFLKAVAVDADVHPADKKAIQQFFKRGLSSGAKIGIGVGSAVALTALAVIAARNGISRGMRGALGAVGRAPVGPSSHANVDDSVGAGSSHLGGSQMAEIKSPHMPAGQAVDISGDARTSAAMAGAGAPAGAGAGSATGRRGDTLTAGGGDAALSTFTSSSPRGADAEDFEEIQTWAQSKFTPSGGAGSAAGAPVGAGSGSGGPGGSTEGVMTGAGAGSGDVTAIARVAEMTAANEPLFSQIKSEFPDSYRFFLYPEIALIGSADYTLACTMSQFYDSLGDLNLSPAANLILHLATTMDKAPVFNCYLVENGTFRQLNLHNPLDFSQASRFALGNIVVDPKLLRLLRSDFSREVYRVSYSELAKFNSKHSSTELGKNLASMMKFLRIRECYEGDTVSGIGVSEMHGFGRPTMEDAVAVTWGDVFKAVAVFDGHGGAEVAELCKEQLLDKLRSLRHCLNSDDEIKKAFSELDEMLRGDIYGNSGSTVTLALILPDGTLKLVNLGDSRSIAVSNAGTVLIGTVDHKPNNIEEERRIKVCGGAVVGNRIDGGLAVSRGFGDYRYKTPSATRDENGRNIYKVSNVPDIITLTPEKTAGARFIVLACDGLWDVMDNAAVARFVFDRKEFPSYDIARQLAIKAVVEDSKDNISVVVIDLQQLGSSSTV